MNAMMEVLKVQLTATRTVRELLFDGYSDAFLDIINKLPVANKPPFKKFGWFVDRNESWSYDGHFEMFSGQADISRMGTLTQWNYVTKTKYYHDECSKISGTSGELWPMAMNATGDLSFYVTDLCRPLTLSYQQQHTRFGVTGSRWVSDNAENFMLCDSFQSLMPILCSLSLSISCGVSPGGR